MDGATRHGASPSFRGYGSAAPAEPLGREAELGAIGAFLSAVETSSAPAALVLVGEAGIGKTLLLRAAAARAAGRRWQVLRAAPAEAEWELAHAGLADLLRDVDPAVIGALPEPQREALAVVLAGVAPAHGSIAPGTIAAALLGVLRRLAAERPVLVVVDDVQWLDAATRSALAYAVRRCDGLPVGILTSLRGVADDPAPLGLARALEPDRLERLVIGPVTVATLFQLLRARLGHAFARSILLRIADWSGGNPLFALEIGRAILETGGAVHAGDPAPVSRELSRTLGDRVRGLPAEVRRTLLLAALATRPTAALLEAAGRSLGWPIRLPDDPSLIGEGAAVVTFAHPLLRAEAAAIATPEERRAAHGALADLADEPEERALHLALATSGTDHDVARVVEAAANDALRRGAPEVATELLELACRLTPADAAEELTTRRVALARVVAHRGDSGRARSLLQQAIADADAGPGRARARADLARLLVQPEGPQAAIAACRAAAQEAGDDPTARPLVELAWTAVTADGLERLEHARAALALLDDGPPALRAQALVGVALAEAQLGRTIEWQLLDEAVELETSDPPELVIDRAEAGLAWLRYMGDEYEPAHLAYERLRRVALALGDDSSIARIAVELAQIDLRVGRWDEVADHAAEAIDTAERNDRERDRIMGIVQLGAVAASRGDRHAAIGHLDEADRYAARVGDPFVAGIVAGNRGSLALAMGDVETAERQFAEHGRWFGGAHVGDPALARFQGDELEALVELGRLDAAAVRADEIEAGARSAGRRRVLALVARGRGVLAAARGDLDAALEACDRSRDEARALGLRFELARTLLVRGMVHRRRREKRLAREDLAVALAIFEELRATGWVVRAQHEIGRVGLRPRAPTELTDTERTVARLAAEGRTSREIAALAFMSPRTVEGVLARAYRKLGVDSRAELGRAMGNEAPRAGGA